MIINGNARAGAFDLARHLSRADTNEHVSVMEVRGTAADDLLGCFREMEGVAAGTRCKKPLYHANIDPACDYVMTEAEWAHAINELEAELGLTGQPRAVVKHTKHGRTHMHVVWARVDSDRMRAIPDSHNYRKHETVARRLEKKFGHAHVQGVHAERQKDQPRPEAKMTTAEGQQAQRSGIDPRTVTAEVTGLWRQTDGARAFVAALLNAGYVPARGDRRGLVIIDTAGEIHSLARRIEGVTTAQLRKRLESLDIERLPTASEARAAVLNAARQRQETKPTATAADPTPTVEPQQEQQVQDDGERIRALALRDAVATFVGERCTLYRQRMDAQLAQLETAHKTGAAQALNDLAVAHKPGLPLEEALDRLKLDQSSRERQAIRDKVAPPQPGLLRRVVEFFVPKLRRERETAIEQCRAAETAARADRYRKEQQALDLRYKNYEQRHAAKQAAFDAAWRERAAQLEARNQKDMEAFKARETASAYGALGTTEEAHERKLKVAPVVAHPVPTPFRAGYAARLRGNRARYDVLRGEAKATATARSPESERQYQDHYNGCLRRLGEDLKEREKKRAEQEKMDAPRQTGPRHRL